MIPKVIHYCWFGHSKMPRLAKKCIRSWKKYLPDYEIKVWNESNVDLSACRYLKEAYEARKFAFVSDWVRLYALHEDGGIYLDTDVEICKSLDDFLNETAFLSYESASRCNTGLIGSERGGKLVSDLLDEYERISFLQSDGTYDVTPNTQRLADMLEKKGIPIDGQHHAIPGYATLYPQEWFCPRKWDERECNITQNTYAIHHFCASWFSARDRWILKVKVKYGERAAFWLGFFWRPFPVVCKGIFSGFGRRVKRLLGKNHS